MGKFDTITKEYMKQKSVFADAFNYFIYGGKQVIAPENLREFDTAEIVNSFKNGDEVAIQKFLEILKMAVLKMDDNALYFILNVENKSDAKYAEPLKTGLYNFLQYSKQVQQIANKHCKTKDWKDRDNGEILSGYYNEDKLIPVISLAILFDSKKWDGPRTLHEMMSTQNPDILKYVADCKLNLIEPAALGVDDLEKFHSSLRAVLGFIKYSDDGEKLEEFLSTEKDLEALDVNAARVIKTCTNTDITINKKAEVVNVCEAVREMNKKARIEALRDSVKNAMESFCVSLEEVMKGLKITKEDQAVLLKML